MSQRMSLPCLVRSQFLAEKAGLELKKIGFKEVNREGILRLKKTPLASHIMLHMVAPKENHCAVDTVDSVPQASGPVAIATVDKRLAHPSKNRSTSVIIGKGAINPDAAVRFRGLCGCEVANPAIRIFDEPSVLTGPFRDSFQNHLESVFESALKSAPGRAYDLVKSGAMILRVPDIDLFVQFSGDDLSILHAALTFVQDKDGPYCSVRNFSEEPLYIGHNGDVGIVVLNNKYPGLISMTSR